MPKKETKKKKKIDVLEHNPKSKRVAAEKEAKKGAK